MSDTITTLFGSGTYWTEVCPALIEAKAITTARKLKIFRNLISDRCIFDFTGIGATDAVPQNGTFTLASTTEGTADTAGAFDPTSRTLTPVTWGATAVIAMQAWNSSKVPPEDMISEAAALADAVQQDDSSAGFAYLYGEPSSANDIGTDGTSMDAALIRLAETKLRTAGAWFPVNAVIDPIQKGELLSDPSAVSELRANEARALTYAQGTGIPLDRYVGMIGSVHIWVGNAMRESSGLHALVFGQNALGYAYKRIATKLSPVPSELNLDINWNPRQRAFEVVLTVCRVNSGIAYTSTTNDWMVNAIS
jgi:hypothetical protein